MEPVTCYLADAFYNVARFNQERYYVAAGDEVVTSAMFLTWSVKLPAMLFTLSVRSFQTPATPRTIACPPSRPSVPTSRATQVTSEAKELS